MNVLISAYACQPGVGSEPGNGWNWSVHMAKLGYQVWVLTVPKGKDAIEKTLAAEPIANLQIIYIDVPGWVKSIKNQAGVYIHYLIWQQEAYKVAQELDQKHHFNLVHHATYGSIILGSSLWRLNKPFIYGPLGAAQVAPPNFKKYFFKGWKGEIIRSFIVEKLTPVNPFAQAAVQNSDLVLYTNLETGKLAENMKAPRSELFLDVGLPSSYFPPELPTRSQSSQLQLLWTGRIFARKGLPLTLEALAKVNPNLPVKLIIFGEGPLAHLIPQWIKDYGVENRVEYRGKIPWLELKEYYLNSDIFFFTSLRDSCPFQLLEAMTHGLPVLTLSLHGSRDLVPDNAGVKVAATNPEETVQGLAKAVEFLYNNPQLRWEMGQNGYEFAKTQTWEQKALKMSQYYEQLAR